MFPSRRRILSGVDNVYMDKFDQVASLFRSVDSVSFYVVDITKNVLPMNAITMSEAFWMPSFLMYNADAKSSPQRIPWPGTYLDRHIQEHLSIPVPQSAKSERLDTKKGKAKKAKEAREEL